VVANAKTLSALMTMVLKMPDLLSLEKINALSHPLMIRPFRSDPWYGLIDIDVQTGLYRMDVCGMWQLGSVSSCEQIMDGDGAIHDMEIFFSDYEEPAEGGDGDANHD
jgi:hypothetical protein